MYTLKFVYEHILANTCDLFRGIRLVSNSSDLSCDLQGHSRSHLLVPLDRPHKSMWMFHYTYIRTEINTWITAHHCPGARTAHMGRGKVSNI